MKIIQVQQGTPEWHEHRQQHFNGSEAAAMLGLDPKMRRDELLRLKVTGDEKEVSDYVRDVIFGQGHRYEAACRPLIEAEIGEDLFPVIGVDDEDERISVSLDGLTMAEDITWEHKQYNAELAASVRDGVLPEFYHPQVQQGLMVSGAEKCIFTVSDGTEKNKVSMEVLPDPEWFKRIRAGWNQFAEDMKNWTPPAAVAEVMPAAIEDLPALTINLVGQVSSSNLQQFKDAALKRIQSVKTDLQTDQDFADADAMVKFFGSTEKELEVAKKAALEQTADIAELFRVIDSLRDEMRNKRLTLEKQVKARKESIRSEIADEANRSVREHIGKLEQSLGVCPAWPAFIVAGAMKGKKTIDSLRAAANQAIADYKIETNDIAEIVRKNLKTLDGAGDYRFLFPDLDRVCNKDPDDFARLVVSRVDEHNKAEEKRKEQEQQSAQEAVKPEQKETAAAPSSDDLTPEHAIENLEHMQSDREEGRSTQYTFTDADDPFDIWWAQTGQLMERAYPGESEVEYRKGVAKAAWGAAVKQFGPAELVQKEA